jgi:hypothetical protein
MDSFFDDEMGDVLGLLASPDGGSGLEIDWLLDGGASSGGESSPPHRRQRLVSPERAPPPLPNVSAATRSLAGSHHADRLVDVSRVSGSMASAGHRPRDCARLGDMSTISTSLAHLGMLRQCNQAAPPADPPQPQAPRSPRLANASSVSRNLASVGAVPQCNQSRAVVPEPADFARADAVGGGDVVAEAVPLASARVVALPPDQSEAHAAAMGEVAATLGAGRPPPPRRRHRGVDEDEFLRLRRARNRKAAERLRNRKRDERDELQRTVRDLTARLAASEADNAARVADLEARLAASEADNARLRGGVGAAALGAWAVEGSAPSPGDLKLRRRARG